MLSTEIKKSNNVFNPLDLTLEKLDTFMKLYFKNKIKNQKPIRNKKNKKCYRKKQH